MLSNTFYFPKNSIILTKSEIFKAFLGVTPHFVLYRRVIKTILSSIDRGGWVRLQTRDSIYCNTSDIISTLSQQMSTKNNKHCNLTNTFLVPLRIVYN